MSEQRDEICPGCGDGEYVPVGETYWICPVCDAEWNEDDEGQLHEAPTP